MNEQFDRFTERARRVLTLSEQEAQRFNHNYIGTEHILLGLVREGEGVAVKVLSNLGVELTMVRSAVELVIGRGEHHPVGEIGLTPRSKKALELAIDEARRLGHHYIGTEHLLLGLIREGEGIAAGILESLGVTLEKARAETIRVLTGPHASTQSQRWGASSHMNREPAERVEYLTLETTRQSGMIVVVSVNGARDPRFGMQHTPLHEALRSLGEEGWELVGLDPPLGESAGAGTLYIFKRLASN